METKENIVLIGFMGCGKTTLGVSLSWKLKMSVDDTDKLIERREGRPISDIFATDGEEYFRRQETLLLQNLCVSNYKRIISVGGGTPVRMENRALLKQLGTVVYLRIQPVTVYKRLQGDTTRPLLQCEDPLQKITNLLESRVKAYEECADIIIDVDYKNVDEILRLLVEKLELQNN